MKPLVGALLLVALSSLSLPRLARADDRLFELGVGGGMTALGSYDVGRGLGLSSRGDDLGPATLGGLVVGGVMLSPTLSATLEAGLAVGGLVGTDERYFGGREDVGSTVAVHAAVGAGWDAYEVGKLRLRLGGRVGAERFSEATGAGFVRLDSLVVGPWLGLGFGSGLWLQLRGELHAPLQAEIEHQTSGDPDGTFLGWGLQLLYLWGIGHRG